MTLKPITPDTSARNEFRSPEPAERPGRELIGWILLAGCFALFASLSWRTWPDVLVDFGHELYIPWRLSEGDVLYRDIAFTMGPLSQYANASLFRLFGVSFSTLIWANLVILMSISAMLYWLFRQCGSTWSATFVLLFFLAVFAFAQYSQIGNYNYVSPYRHEVTHGLALGLAQIICLVNAAGWYAPVALTSRQEQRWLIAAGGCLGLIFLTKVELFVPAAAVATAVMLEMARTGQRKRIAGYFIASAAVPVLLAFLLLFVPLGARGALRATLGSWVYAMNPALTSQSGFYRALGGWDRSVENLEQMALSAVCVVAAFVAGVLLETMLRGFRISRRWTTLLTGSVGCVGILFISSSVLSLMTAGMPLLLLAVVIGAFPGFWRGRDGLTEMKMLFVLSLFALSLLPKILLAVNWGHYGFVLAMPGVLILVHLVVHTLPQWLRRSGYSGAYFRAVAVGLLGACALSQALTWIRIDDLKTMSFGSGEDLIYVDPRYDDRATPTVKTLAYLQQSMKPAETLLVIPEGTTLNYLLRRRNPTGFLMFSPWEFDALGGESRFLEALMQALPDYVVLVTMDMTIHGRGNFGDPGFGQSIRAFIDRNYRLVDGHSSTDPAGQPTFQSAIFRRLKTD